jgi:NAD(P)H-dependent flavin oxidoreductase YrpB (nitropropane dioxygenase family)
MNITRHQLMGLGASRHQAAELTKALAPVGKQSRSNLYALSEVLQAIALRLSNKRIRTTTRTALAQLQSALNELTINVVSVPFGAPKDELTDAVKQLMKSAANPKTLKHKMKAAELKGKEFAGAR